MRDFSRASFVLLRCGNVIPGMVCRRITRNMLGRGALKRDDGGGPRRLVCGKYLLSFNPVIEIAPFDATGVLPKLMCAVRHCFMRGSLHRMFLAPDPCRRGTAVGGFSFQ